MTLTSVRLLLRLNADCYDLGRLTLQDDGSLYVSLPSVAADHAPAEPSGLHSHSAPAVTDAGPAFVKISYHASGLVRYHVHEKTSRCFEPLPEVRSVNAFAQLDLVDVRRLRAVCDANEDDVIHEVDASGPWRLRFAIVPWQLTPYTAHFAVRWEQMFALLVEVSKHPVDDTKPHIHVSPLVSTLANVQMAEDQAYIAFHQLRGGTRGLIVYSPNAAGVYKVVCAVPMRIAPRLEVKFLSDEYVAEPLAPHPKRGTAEVSFRVKGKGGYVTHEVSIASIALDAEL